MLNVAVVGCGRWGQNYIRNLSELPDCRLVMCCDTNPERLKALRERYSFVRTVKNYNQVANNPKVDAVIVATPPGTHYSIARACLLKGKHVLVEKPFTLSSEDAEQLVDLAVKARKILMVGHILDYHPAVLHLKDILSSGELGRIYYVHASRTSLGVIREDVSVAWDKAPHDLAILLYMLGSEPTHVAMKGQAFINDGIEDVAFITLKFPDGIVASIHTSWLDPCKISRTTVVGERGMVVFDDIEPREKVRVYNKYSPSAYGDIYIPNIDMSEPLKNECLHFLECIRERKQPKTDGENGLKVVKILERAEESLRANGEYLPISDEAYEEAARQKWGFVARARSFWKGLRLEKIF